MAANGENETHQSSDHPISFVICARKEDSSGSNHIVEKAPTDAEVAPYLDDDNW